MKQEFSSIILGLSLLMFFAVFSTQVDGQDKPFLKHATVYIIRHAEKDTGNNPKLTSAGRQRAGHLVAAMEGNHIHKVFVSQYRRTQETADSFRLNMKVDTVHYLADATGEGLIQSMIKHQIKNEEILIVGHSNTIPVMLGRLGISKPVTMNDSEYNTIYLVKYVKGEPMLFRKKFGDPMVQADNSSWEEVL